MASADVQTLSPCKPGRAADGIESMFDFDLGKVFLFGMVALVVVGPKDLPPLLRMLGQIIGRIRKTSDEVKRQFAEVINDADLDGIQHQLDAIAQSPIDIAVNPQTVMRGQLPSLAEAPNAAVAESPMTAAAETTYVPVAGSGAA